MSVCLATLSIEGATYQCELAAPHTGVAHLHEGAQAHWCSHGEAVSAQKKPWSKRPRRE